MMTKTPLILIVEDEPALATLIKYHLEQCGYETILSDDGNEVLNVVESYHPDLILLDLMLPHKSGLDICKQLRSEKHFMPIIMLTALAETHDIISGLDHGADDYITKPFSVHLLKSRVQAALRRSSVFNNAPHLNDDPAFIDESRVSIDLTHYIVWKDERVIDLTPTEFEIIAIMSSNLDRVTTRQQLVDHIWHVNRTVDLRTIDVHIRHLREKIEVNPKVPKHIITIRNRGYKLHHAHIIKQ